MAWRRPGDKPLSEPMMVSSLTHICVTRPQWVLNKFTHLLDSLSKDSFSLCLTLIYLSRPWPLVCLNWILYRYKLPYSQYGLLILYPDHIITWKRFPHQLTLIILPYIYIHMYVNTSVCRLNVVSRLLWVEQVLSLEINSCHDTKFVITGSIMRYPNDNFWFHQ